MELKKEQGRKYKTRYSKDLTISIAFQEQLRMRS